MIEYDPASYVDVIFRWRGSVVLAVLPYVVLTLVASLVVAVCYDEYDFVVDGQAFSLTIIALGFLLVFRSNLSYGRYWEGRSLLATMVAVLHDLGRMCTMYVDGSSPSVDDAKKEFVRHLKVFFVLTRMHLRREQDLDQDKVANKLLTDAEKKELEGKPRRPLIVFGWLASTVFALHRAGHVSKVRLQCFERQFAELVGAFNGVDKILNTPMPFPYAQLLLIMLMGYCVTVPLTLVQSFKWKTFLPACLVTAALFGINTVALEIEDPFGYDANDLPIDEINDKLLEDLDLQLDASKRQN